VSATTVLPPDVTVDQNAARPTRPACRNVPVLPSVPDVTMDSCSGSLNFTDVLSKEERDPGWAIDMEARIRDTVRGAEGLALARLEVECRMTSCAILLVHADGSDASRQQSVVTELVRDAVGFQQWGGTAGLATHDGKAFSTIGLMRAVGREQLWPAPPGIPALPGVAGVEIPLLGISAIDNGHPAKRLAEETDNPSWARAMESRVINAVSASAPESWYQSFVECRSTTCGVVLLYPPETNVDVRGLEAAVAEVLGLMTAGGRSYQRETGTLVTLYLNR
jgi:hypothetical protein